MNTANVDPFEIAKFSRLSSHWWDTIGSLKTLHAINPLRIDWIMEKVALAGKKVIDVGCGGGILAESMAQQGAEVTGIDINQEAISVANLHKIESHLAINYYLLTAEQAAADFQAKYDVVTCLEMLEHVPEPASVIQACADLIKPGGHLFFSTVNRNVKSYLSAIVGAEYLLKLLPKGTHDYRKCIRPSELAAWAREVGLTLVDIVGISYHCVTQEFKLSADVSVNYLAYFWKEGI
jgi:2-polyprenyl-6-hydroxyphenyl methylase/3-demethylubiquinone-9 3-methyltransferase